MITRPHRNDSVWDAVVIGAGPAGCIAAMQLAQAGVQVLLVERKGFPRDKVCGGCLNFQALRVLQALGLEQLARESNGAPLNRLMIRASGGELDLPLPSGMAICRSEFDAALAQQAVACGAEFMMGATARIVSKEPGRPASSDWHQLQLESAGQPPHSTRARLVVLAGGLQSAYHVAPHLLSSRIAPDARIGVGAVLPESTLNLAQRVVHMNVTPAGYAGAVRLADGRQIVAAALERDFVGRFRSPAAAVRSIFEKNGWTNMWSAVPLFHGTPPLTRTLDCPAAERLFVIGDAASYVEPFTGEGMASAMTTALAVIPFALRGMSRWEPELAAEWVHGYGQLVRKRQAWCRAFTAVSRSPWLARAAMTVSNIWPELPGWIARRVVAACACPENAGLNRLREPSVLR